MKKLQTKQQSILSVKNWKSYPDKKFQFFVNRFFHYNKQNLCLWMEDSRKTFQLTITLFLLINFPQKLNLGKTHDILCKPDFSSATKDWISLPKNQNKNCSWASDCWEYTKSFLRKKMLGHFPLSTTQEKIKISRLKMRLRKLYKKENFTPEIKPMIENVARWTI